MLNLRNQIAESFTAVLKVNCHLDTNEKQLMFGNNDKFC